MRISDWSSDVCSSDLEGVVVDAGRDLGHLLQQLFQQGAGEQVVGLGQHALERLVVLLDLAHRLVDPGADVGGFGQGQQVLVARVRRQVQAVVGVVGGRVVDRSEEHTSELQSLMRSSYAVFCLKKKNEPSL